MKEVWIYDLETFSNFHSATFLSLRGEIKQFYIHNTNNQLPDYIEFLENRVSGLIGFNCVNYDYPLLHSILKAKVYLLKKDVSAVTRYIYNESSKLINAENTSIKPNEVLIPQLDLYLIWHFNNKNKRTSLKYIEINTQFENVEDLPFDEDHFVQLNDITKILSYNLNDVKATEHFYKLSIDDIEMRKELMQEFGFSIEFLNYNDPKIGEQIFAKEIAKAMGISMYDLKKLGSRSEPIALKDIILPKIKFTSKEFNNLLDKFNSSVVSETKNPFEYSVIYKGFKCDYGVGGVHGCIKPGVYNADNNYEIYDIDIDGMYPSTAINNEFYPRHLGKLFCHTYKNMFDKRMRAKETCKIDPKNLSAKAINSGLKLANNGVYGKSNDKFSFLYDPRFTMQITVNGQLLLSMLIERIANMRDVIFLQVNTDGITIKIHKTKVEEFKAICKQWEEETGYTLEYNNYKKMIIRDVNNYLAQYTNDKLKYKGMFEITPMQNGKIAYHKNWSMRIVPIALRDYYINGTPVEETIRNHKDIYNFCLAKKFPKPWQGEFTEMINNQPIKTVFKKNLRYYVSTKGSYLWKVNTKDGRETQINVGYTITPFNKFEEKENYNINYNFYISECNKIISTIDDGQLVFDWFK